MFRGSDRNEMARYAVIFQVGMEIAVPPAGGALLDWYLNTTPWFIVAGVVLGFTVGLFHLVQMSNRLEEVSRGRKSGEQQKTKSEDETPPPRSV